MNMSEVKISTCCTCGYSWRTGMNGNHSCSDALLRTISKLENELIQTQIVVTEIQDLSSNVSCFVENLNECNLMQRAKALNACLEIGSKIRDLDLPEFTLK